MKPYDRNPRLESILEMIKAEPYELLTSFDVAMLLKILEEREKEIQYLKEEYRKTDTAYAASLWER